MDDNNSLNKYELEEDEIDLRELFQTILKGKKVILLTMMVIVSLSFIYVLKLPNIYKSEAVLIPVMEDSQSSLGGLGGLAAMAGVSIGGGGAMTPDVAFKSLLKNYEFMKTFVEKNKIVEYYLDEQVDENYVFAFGFRGLYELFKNDKDPELVIDYNEEVFDIVKKMQKNFSITSDKKTALITVTYNDADRDFPVRVLNAFLEDASDYLVQNNLRIINEKLKYFHKELELADGFELRKSLSATISSIVQEKVIMQSKVYYQCDVLIAPSQAYIKDKSKPKRGLILVVSFVTSMILGIFLVFFLSFIRQDEKSDNLIKES